MNYNDIWEGRFESRPNRFIAYVNIAGRTEKVHVKNTGRCRELLTDNAQVFLNKSDNPKRSTVYDLVAVKKNERIINMDSQAPNKAVEEWLLGGGLFEDITVLRPETTYGRSRFDFYVETPKEKIFIEVKGVTLEQEDVVLFPDAPSERAVKHINELIQAVKEGYKAYILFVIQMEDVMFFTPNRNTHPEFAEALLRARQAGVEVFAYDCKITPDSMRVNSPVPVKLSEIELAADSLLKWYDSGRRILPWREDATPYHVWVSEIMLQQTRVEAVKPYYDRFMKALPDISALAGAEEEALLKLWEGLGYYNRVKNLKKAAQVVMEEYGGRMPQAYEDLIKLPGIGSYTAGAISSIAYGRRVPAVDGNVLRVLSRLRGDDRDISKAGVRTEIEEELLTAIPEERPGDFNQALMELGAMVCVPVGVPRCIECPWEKCCNAHLMGRELEFPYKTPKKPRTIEEKTILVIRDETRAALMQRPKKGLLAGMYEFPCLEGHLTKKQVITYLKKEGLSVLKVEALEGSRHIFTHKEWHMIGYAVRVDELAKKDSQGSMIFAEPDEIKDKYPIPSAYRVYVQNFLS
ncbi:MAG: A/G-specific adenine glycosylase [Lachnospiraceae bacterium]|nr:A/G-specific adenine glycosylase [Lachnospiraceae bacterium]